MNTPRWLTRLGGRLVNRRLIFALVAITVLNAKLAHLHSHRLAVVPKRMILFFGSFLAQDVLLLIFLRLLLDHWLPSTPKIMRLLSTALTGLLIAYNIALAVISVTFYFVAGSEIHWRNIGLVSDPTSRAIMLSGLLTFIVVVATSLFLSWLLQDVLYKVFGWGADVVNWPFAFAGRTIGRFRGKTGASYGRIPQREADDEAGSRYTDGDDEASLGSDSAIEKSPALYSRLSLRLHNVSGIRVQPSTVKRILNALPYVIVSLVLLAQIASTLARPKDASLVFLSWTAGLLPFVDFSSSSPYLDELPSFLGTGIQRQWDEKSALTKTEPLSWLPQGKPLPGFEDWYTQQPHYNASADPMKISNLNEPLYESLRGQLENINVQHVVLFLLESTRNDIFPIKKDGVIWNRFQESFPNGELPEEAKERLATLTPTANYITGDYDDGFEHAEKPKRGGVRFTNAHTASTYTLKSLTGTICGLTPLVADFNVDYDRHIYQPCLPHIFEAMNQAQIDQTIPEETRSKWKSYFYQAATLKYDNFDTLMMAMGFPEENLVDREYLRSEDAKHGPVNLPNINYFAFEEDPLEDYIRDMFVDAKETNDRVFFTHITSTSHHAYKMPANETYVPLAKGLDMMSRYANAEGYDDRWIRKVLNVLDEQGVADETLVIFLGDHGVSLPENDNASPYYNPNIGVDHVPLILSHPQLPPFDVNDAVHSTQVLPTILDILLETGSLNEASRRAALDLVGNYEGQSLLRPLKTSDETTGQGQWQFTVVNPGRAMVTVRDARYPERHLVVPVIENVEWRLTNITADPLEKDSTQAFDFVSFIQSVESRYGREWAEWAEEGAFMTRWYIKENGKRWRHGQ